MISKLCSRPSALLKLRTAMFSSTYTSVFASNLPATWGPNDIAARFGVAGTVQKVNPIVGEKGQLTGKVMITFADNKSASAAIELFAGKEFAEQKVTITPYEEVNESKKAGLFNRRVYLSNLPHDTTEFEIRQLCQEIAAVDQVHIAQNEHGQSKGFAFVFMKNAKDVKTLINFVQNREIDGKVIEAKATLGGALFKKELNESTGNPEGLSEADAQDLVDYQNYCKRAFKANQLRDSRFGSHIDREIERISLSSNLSKGQAAIRLAESDTLSAPELNSVEYFEQVSRVEKMIETTEANMIKKNAEIESLKDEFPKSYMYAQVQKLIQKKQGLSETEVFSGVSDVVFGSQQFGRMAKPKLSEREIEVKQFNY